MVPCCVAVSFVWLVRFFFVCVRAHISVCLFQMFCFRSLCCSALSLVRRVVFQFGDGTVFLNEQLLRRVSSWQWNQREYKNWKNKIKQHFVLHVTHYCAFALKCVHFVRPLRVANEPLWNSQSDSWDNSLCFGKVEVPVLWAVVKPPATA